MSNSLKAMDFEANTVAREHMGEFAWPTVILAIAVIVLWFGTMGAAMAGWIPLWIGFLIGSITIYLNYTVMHEAVHGSISGKHKSLSWVNAMFGYVSAQILGLSFELHRREHLAHHRGTNKLGEDPDMIIKSENLFGVMIAALRGVPANYEFYWKHHRKLATRRENTIVLIETFFIIATRIGVVLAGFWQEALIFYVLATLVGIFILNVFFAWLVHHPHTETDRYKNTSTIVFPESVDSAVSWLWLYQNYHSIHHLFPRVPFFRYRQVFRKIEHVMDAHGAPIKKVGSAALQPA